MVAAVADSKIDFSAVKDWHVKDTIEFIEKAQAGEQFREAGAAFAALLECARQHPDKLEIGYKYTKDLKENRLPEDKQKHSEKGIYNDSIRPGNLETLRDNLDRFYTPEMVEDYNQKRSVKFTPDGLYAKENYHALVAIRTKDGQEVEFPAPLVGVDNLAKLEFSFFEARGNKVDRVFGEKREAIVEQKAHYLETFLKSGNPLLDIENMAQLAAKWTINPADTTGKNPAKPKSFSDRLTSVTAKLEKAIQKIYDRAGKVRELLLNPDDTQITGRSQGAQASLVGTGRS